MRCFRWLGWFMVLGLAGCMSLPTPVENPTTVVLPNCVRPEQRYDLLWDTTIRVLEKYFDVAYENRYFGQIESKPQASATLLELWRPDAVDFGERLEASLQTIRRRAFLLIQPAPADGFIITVEVYKELEDIGFPLFATFVGGTYTPSIQPLREGIVASEVPPAAGWISLGRDLKLEAKIIQELHEALDGIAPTETP